MIRCRVCLSAPSSRTSSSIRRSRSTISPTTASEASAFSTSFRTSRVIWSSDSSVILHAEVGMSRLAAGGR